MGSSTDLRVGSSTSEQTSEFYNRYLPFWTLEIGGHSHNFWDWDGLHVFETHSVSQQLVSTTCKAMQQSDGEVVDRSSQLRVVSVLLNVTDGDIMNR